MQALGALTPTREQFRAFAADRRVIPVSMRVLADALTPISIYRRLAGGRPGTFLMESAAAGECGHATPSSA